MQDNITPEVNLCACGCGGSARDNEFVAEHDIRLYRAIVLHVGGVAQLREIIERITGTAVEILQ